MIIIVPYENRKISLSLAKRIQIGFAEGAALLESSSLSKFS
jgi:hypothetical protein